MKKALSLILAAAFIVCALALAGCKTKPRRDTGNIEVDYGKLVADGGTIENVMYRDETPITFLYPNYFKRSSDEEDSFVAKGPDDNSVLMFEDSELSEARSYETIAAYSDEEAKAWLTEIQLGLVSSQGVASTDIKQYSFLKLEDHLYLLLDADVTYSTGLVQRNTIVDYILPEGRMYTVHAFAPVSAFNKYGPLFSEVMYNGVPADEALPTGADAEGYKTFDNGSVTFLYKEIFDLQQSGDSAISFVPDSYAMLTYDRSTLKAGYTYEQLAAMPNGELLSYLSSFTALTGAEAELIKCTEEDGHLKLETVYTSSVSDVKLYCSVTQFVFKDGTTETVFAYMNEPEAVKNVSYIG